MKTAIFTKDEVAGLSKQELLNKLEQQGFDLRVGYKEEINAEKEHFFTQDPDGTPLPDDNQPPEIELTKEEVIAKKDKEKKSGAADAVEIVSKEVEQKILAKREANTFKPIEKTMSQYYMKEVKISSFGRWPCLFTKYKDSPKQCVRSTAGQPRACGCYCAGFTASGKSVEICTGQTFDLVKK